MHKNTRQKVSQICNRTFFIVCIVSILEISGDSAMAWTSPILPKLLSNDTTTNPIKTPITPEDASWIGSLLTIGALVGSFPFSIISETYGRKIALLLVALPNIVAYLILAVADNIYAYFVARFLLGFGIGAKCTVIPVYIAEVSKDTNRGMYITATNIFANFGELLSYSLGPYLSILWFNTTLALVPSLFVVLFAFLAPETPYFLLRKNKDEDAKKSLEYLRGSKSAKVGYELDNLKFTLQQSSEVQGKYFDLLKSSATRKALSLALLLTVTEQMSGLSAYLFYTEEIFQEVYPSAAVHLYPIIIGLVLFGSSFISPFLVESLGRRVLLIVSFTGMIAANVALGAYFYLKTHHFELVSQAGYVSVSSMVFYIIAMNVGIGPLMWTVACELFPSHLQSPALCVVGTSSWLISFIVTNFFEEMVQGMGKAQTFWMFGAFCIFTLACIYYYLPETKGKSFAEIQIALKKH